MMAKQVALPLISAVIPAYNPERYLLETVASVERQSYGNWECVIVDDGTDKPESREILAAIEQRDDPRIRVVRQTNKGLAGARNTGFREARGEFVVPLDADDMLEPEMMAVCREELERRPDCAFAYFDYRVFGDFNYLEQPGEYNVYRLLHENFMACCCFVPKAVWEKVGGYDEWHRWGYEDWSFFLNLAKHGKYGLYIPQPLFRYRTHGKGLHYIGLERHETNWAHMEEVHPELLSPEGRLRVKRSWAPSICVVSAGPPPDLENQTLRDFQLLQAREEEEILERSRADCFLWVAGVRSLKPQALEECVWALQTAEWVTWRDTGEAPPASLRDFAGPLGVARRVLEWPEPKQGGEVRRLPWSCGVKQGSGPGVEPWSDSPVEEPPAPAGAPPERWWPRVRRHLENAELLSGKAWRRRPHKLLARLLPLRFKEWVNALFGRTVFDLSFYLRFQPRAAVVDGALVRRVDYIVPPKGKRRLALVTPHLGVGGAESVLLELVRQIDRDEWEVLLLATRSDDRRLTPEWRQAVDRIFDLAKLMPAERAPQAVYSIALNWELDALLVQNTLAAYAVLPSLKSRRPQMRTADLLHAVDDEWDFFEATANVAEAIDRRIVISAAGRDKLLMQGCPEERITLAPNGVDTRRFDPAKFNRALARHQEGLGKSVGAVAFVGRLDPVKRPLLLPEVAKEIRRIDPDRRIEFLIVGSGTEEEALASRALALGMAWDEEGAAQSKIGFRVYGHVPDPESVLAMADVLILTSRSEGVPLAAIEALAMGVPVVSVRVGAVEEAVTPDCGIVVEGGSQVETRLADALLEILGDPDLRRRMSEAGRARAVREFSLDAARRRYREALTALTETVAS